MVSYHIGGGSNGGQRSHAARALGARSELGSGRVERRVGSLGLRCILVQTGQAPHEAGGEKRKVASTIDDVGAIGIAESRAMQGEAGLPVVGCCGRETRRGDAGRRAVARGWSEESRGAH